MKSLRRWITVAVSATLGLALSACEPEGDPSYTIGGMVSGLASGQQVTLQNNGADTLTLTADGALSFATLIALNGSYSVTVGTQPTGQTCTVSNGSGVGVTANVANVAVTCAANTYTVGGTVAGLGSGRQVTLQNNGADALTLNANGGFTFATPIVHNGSFSVTVGTQPTGESCTVASGSGSGVTSNLSSVTVTCGIHNVYVSDAANGQIFQYGIQADGTLSPLPSPVVTIAGPSHGMAVHPNGRSLYATVNGQNSVAQFNIGADGSLTAMTTPMVAAGTSPFKAVVSPDGRFLFVGNQGAASVTSFTIGRDGSLAAVGTFSCTADCTNTQGLAVDPSNSHLYIVGAQNSYVVKMTIANDGSLSGAASTYAWVTNPGYVVIDSTGSFLVTAAGSSLAKFSIAPTTGALTFSSSTAVAGSGAMQMLFAPSGSHLYLGMYTSATLEQFSWSSGTLAALSPASVSAGALQAGVHGMVIDSTGKYVYTVNRISKDISQFVVGSGGLLSLNPVSGLASIPGAPSPDPFAIATR